MSKSRALIPVLAGIAGIGMVGTLAYALRRRAQRADQVCAPQAQVERASSPGRSVRESMVVPRSSVPEPVTVVLDLDGVFRGESELEAELAEATVQCDVKLPSPISADDGEPPEADALGAYWLSRATQSERSLSEGDLDIDLDNVADFRDEDAPDEDEYGHDQVLERALLAAGGSWPRG
ncbi:MAG TPA: hypothetical protein VHW01_13100 [Polyangiaceae bacterium]|nr:hypothetical protein [Polyangiaceae bacterium]